MPAEDEAAASIKASIERFEAVEIDRSQIQNADYNPRTITDAAKRRLRAGIKKLGLLQPIVWNRRTGNIVGGHQRIAIVDKLEGGKPYRLTVAAVDLNEKQEREANLLLNNAAAMGEFDLSRLEAVIKTPDLDLEAAGWDHADIYRLFGTDEAISSLPEEDAAKVADSIRQAAAKHDEAIKQARERDSCDFFLVVVCESYAERKALTDRLGLDDNRYQSGRDVAAALDSGE
jgi:ParB-like chromosome segregation protein Spo0J